jgi:hypothetical protein
MGPLVRVYTIVQHGIKLALCDSDNEAPKPSEEYVVI